MQHEIEYELDERVVYVEYTYRIYFGDAEIEIVTVTDAEQKTVRLTLDEERKVKAHIQEHQDEWDDGDEADRAYDDRD